MDFEEYVSANYKRLEGQTRELVEDAFKAGQQSKQAEIDALKAELAKYQKDGYKLIPVEPSKEKLKEIEEKCFEHPDCFGIDCPIDVIYRAIAGEME